MKNGTKKVKLAKNYFLEEDQLPRFISLSVGQINGLHPTIELLLQDLAPLREISNETLSQEALLRLLEIHPISVQNYEKGWRCVGGIQLFHLAKKRLREAIELICILPKTVPPAALQKRVVEELILGSVTAGISAGDVRIAGKLARNAASAKLLNMNEIQAEKWVADIYGVDKRTVKALSGPTSIPITGIQTDGKEADLPDHSDGPL